MMRTILNWLFGWEKSPGKTITHEEFPMLFSVVAGGLHQDIDLEYDTVPEALAGYARFTEPAEKQMLVDEMTRFLEKYADDLDGEFERRYGFDFKPGIIGQTVPEFFDMLRTIMDDPESHARFDPHR